MIIEKGDLKLVKLNSKKLVFTCGCFNLLHPGHVYFLRNCSRFGDLVVAVAHDEVTKYKRTPTLTQQQRMYMIDNIKGISYVIPEDPQLPPNNIESLLIKLQPDLFITNTDNPNLISYMELCTRLDINPVIYSRRTDGIFNISTSSIITDIELKYQSRLKNDYGNHTR